MNKLKILKLSPDYNYDHVKLRNEDFTLVISLEAVSSLQYDEPVGNYG